MMEILLPFPTQRTSLTKTSNASHSGSSNGSRHSLQKHITVRITNRVAYGKQKERNRKTNG